MHQVFFSFLFPLRRVNNTFSLIYAFPTPLHCTISTTAVVDSSHTPSNIPAGIPNIYNPSVHRGPASCIRVPPGLKAPTSIIAIIAITPSLAPSSPLFKQVRTEQDTKLKSCSLVALQVCLGYSALPISGPGDLPCRIV